MFAFSFSLQYSNCTSQTQRNSQIFTVYTVSESARSVFDQGKIWFCSNGRSDSCSVRDIFNKPVKLGWFHPHRIKSISDNARWSSLFAVDQLATVVYDFNLLAPSLIHLISFEFQKWETSQLSESTKRSAAETIIINFRVTDECPWAVLSSCSCLIMATISSCQPPIIKNMHRTVARARFALQNSFFEKLMMPEHFWKMRSAKCT